MLSIFKHTPQIKFLKYSKYFIGLSIILSVATVAMLLLKGLELGLDFRGGTEVQIKFESSVNNNEIQSNLESALNTKINIINVANAVNEVLVSFSGSQSGGSKIDDINKQITNSLNSAGLKFHIVSLSSIGPKLGDEIKKNAWYSILLSLALVLVYMAFRFNLNFGIGAIVALIHDTLITVGAFAVFRVEFDLTALAGVLTLIGYSLNDTIVIFDRVRENLQRHPGKSLPEIIDLSVNETLSRTILTVTTTFIIILAMFLFGGESIRGFSFSFLIGLIIGTYSSVFIASPVAIVFNSYLQKRIKTKMPV